MELAVREMDLYKRHCLYWKYIRPVGVLFAKLKFGYKFQKIKAEELPETYIVLSNHVTDFDAIFVGAGFEKQMYFVASEHVSRKGLASKLLKHFFAPISRAKGTTAASTVMEMIRKIREGKSVCMFAEGACSWDGVTAKLLPVTGKVIKSAKCALVTYRLEGGYFASPRWGEGGTRRGPVSGQLVNVYTKEQIASMSIEEINQVIARDLHEDAYERQLAAPIKYKGRKRAERLENLLFICPKCGATDSIYSKKAMAGCRECGLQFTYNEYAMLEGIEQKTVRELYAWQKERVIAAGATGELVYTAPDGILQSVVRGKETILAQGPISLSKEKLTCGTYEIPFGSILDLTMHGKHTLVFSTTDAYYELKPTVESNALKFNLLYELYKTGTIK